MRAVVGLRFTSGETPGGLGPGLPRGMGRVGSASARSRLASRSPALARTRVPPWAQRPSFAVSHCEC